MGETAVVYNDVPRAGSILVEARCGVGRPQPRSSVPQASVCGWVYVDESEMKRFRIGSLRHSSAGQQRARRLGRQVIERGRAGRKELTFLVPLFVAVVVAYNYRVQLFGLDTPVRIATVVALVAFGMALARALGRALGPSLLERLGPGAAGTVGFLVRLATIVIAALVALRVAGIRPQTLAAGSAVTALILGLAAQQTLGNVIAGAVILTTGHMKVGDQVRVQRSTIGPIEGAVASVGLLYTKINQEHESVMVPNNLLITAAIVPLRKPAPVELRARLPQEIKPSELQNRIQSTLTTPISAPCEVSLEEVNGGEVCMTIAASPARGADPHRLEDEILAAVSGLSGSNNGSNKTRSQPSQMNA